MSQFDLGIENEALKGELGEIYCKWLSDSKYRIKVSYDHTRKNKETYPKAERDIRVIRPYIISF